MAAVIIVIAAVVIGEKQRPAKAKRLFPDVIIWFPIFYIQTDE